MAKTTTMDIYVKGEIVFSYVRGEGDFNHDDIEVRIHDKKHSDPVI